MGKQGQDNGKSEEEKLREEVEELVTEGDTDWDKDEED